MPTTHLVQVVHRESSLLQTFFHDESGTVVGCHHFYSRWLNCCRRDDSGFRLFQRTSIYVETTLQEGLTAFLYFLIREWL